MLSELQIRHFRDTGYLRLSDVLDAGQIEDLLWLLRSETTRERPPTGKLYQLYDRHPMISSLVRQPYLVIPLIHLLGPNVVYVRNRHNQASLNAPGHGQERLHRDILQWTRGLVTVIVYLEDATVDNGCTQLVPGSHMLPFVGVPQPDGGGTWMDEHADYEGLLGQALPVPAKAGDALIIDSLVFHTAGANHSDRSRASLTLGFRAVDELERAEHRPDQILVAGQFLYRGNN